MIDIASINRTSPAAFASTHAAANARGLVLQNVRVLSTQSPLARPVPLRAWHASDSHRSRR
ncbi:MAG: hypothetical protein WA642_19795, partial [Steroidobacteraceae bacterium]